MRDKRTPKDVCGEASVISGLAKTIRILEATTPPKKKENKTVSSVSKGT